VNKGLGGAGGRWLLAGEGTAGMIESEEKLGTRLGAPSLDQQWYVLMLREAILHIRTDGQFP